MKRILMLVIMGLFLINTVFASQLEKDILWAIKTDSDRKAKELIDNHSEGMRIDFDYVDPTKGHTMLILACQKGNFKIVDLMLEEAEDDIDLEITDKEGKTALVHAVRAGNLDIVKKLLKEEAEIEATDNNGLTPLMHSLIEKNEDIALFLIGMGADINARDVRKGTPLMYAVANDMRKATKQLVISGAERFAENKQGLTAFDVAEQVNNKHLLAVLNNKVSSNAPAKKEIKLFTGSAGGSQTGNTAIVIILALIAGLYVLKEKFGALKNTENTENKE